MIASPVAVAVLVAGVAALVAYYRTPLHVDVDGGVIRVDVQTLGENPTRVARVRLTDARTGEVVWESRARQPAELSVFEFSVGENARWIRGVPWDRYEVVTPAGPAFRVVPGRTYVLEVWGSQMVMARRSSELRIPAGLATLRGR